MVGVYLSMKNVDVENVLINLIRMFQRHIYIFDECRTMVREKYPGDYLLAPQSTRYGNCLMSDIFGTCHISIMSDFVRRISVQ